MQQKQMVRSLTFLAVDQQRLQAENKPKSRKKPNSIPVAAPCYRPHGLLRKTPLTLCVCGGLHEKKPEKCWPNS